MHISKYFVFGLVLIGLIGCFMPWAQTVQFGETSHINGLCFAEGGFTLASFLLVGILTAIKTKDEQDLNSYFKTTLGLGLIITSITVYKLSVITGQTETLAGYGIDVSAITRYHPAYGLYMSFAAALGITITMAVQFAVKYKHVLLPTAKLRTRPQRQFYLPAHHTTSL